MGKTIVTKEYSTLNYTRYVGNDEGREVVVYLPKYLGAVPSSFEILINRTPASAREDSRQLIIKNSENLERQTELLDIINGKMTQIANAFTTVATEITKSNTKPKRKYTRRKK